MIKRKYPNIYPVFADNFPKIFFHEISPKSFPQSFLLIFTFSENLPKPHREFPEKIIIHEFYQNNFPEFDNFPRFSANFETILVNARFQFCLAAESIGKDDQPKLGRMSSHIIT